MMAAPQDWAPYSRLEDTTNVYLRGFVDFPAIQAFIMSRKTSTDTDFYCESFSYSKSVDDGGLAQMERLMQFGKVLSRFVRTASALAAATGDMG
jgi:hypothetical protein